MLIMPINFEGMNDDYITLFDLMEYVERIKILPNVKEHLKYTNEEFVEYMKKVAQLDNDNVLIYLFLLLYQELVFNQKIENQKFDIYSLADRAPFFDTLSISHKRIHQLHNFVIAKEISEGTMEETFDYRNVPVNVSRITKEKGEEIFYRGANPKDVHKFMSEFIKVYKQISSVEELNDPFLASALMHLLFVRIHPYTDGNGRTARVIHNMKFTEMINKEYGTRLKLSPLNLSASILINKITYVKRLNNIYFNTVDDTNDSINKWFDFVLDMVDERLYVAKGQLGRLDSYILGKMEHDEQVDVKSMRLSRFKRYL